MRMIRLWEKRDKFWEGRTEILVSEAFRDA
jgi:hypothetical protein